MTKARRHAARGRRHGLVLVYVVAVLCIIAMLLCAFASGLALRVRADRLHSAETSARWAAASGVESAISAIHADPQGAAAEPHSVSVNDCRVDVRVEPAGEGTWLVRAVATTGDTGEETDGVQQTVRATVERVGPDGSVGIVRWSEGPADEQLSPAADPAE